MSDLSKEEMDVIEAQLKTEEIQILIELLLNSKDENVKSVLAEALAVVKIIHTDELDERLKEVKDNLITAAEMERRERQNEILRELRRARENKKKINPSNPWERKWDYYDDEYEGVWTQLKKLYGSKSAGSAYDDWSLGTFKTLVEKAEKKSGK